MFMQHKKLCMRFKIYLLFIALSGICFEAKAWGPKGHKMCGAIAIKYAKAKVIDSLQYYLGERNLDNASVWMDEVRKDSSYNYMKPWHFVTFPKGEDYNKNEENVITKLSSVINELKHRKALSKERIAFDIKVLTHLVEDIQQPCHAGYKSDNEALDVKVQFQGHETSLHWAWDDEILQAKNLELSQCLNVIAKMRQSERKKAEQTDVVGWMRESRAYLTNVYDFDGKTIDEKYMDKNLPLIEKRIAYGGLRLAHILNTIFG